MSFKDSRYETVKALIEAKKITRFDQIFENNTLPKTVLARDLSKNTKRIGKVIENPERFSIKNTRRMAELIGVPHCVILALLDEQDLHKSNNPDK